MKEKRLSLLIIALTVIAFALRMWRLYEVPAGYRDDELINSLVISQKVLDGDIRLFYSDASGHEFLYHALTALTMLLFGKTALGFRAISILCGTLSVPLTYLVGRRLFSRRVGAVAAAALTISFWSLMYSRFGLRHVLLVPLVLGAVYTFWTGLKVAENRRCNFVLTGVWLGVGFYVYFAARGVPLIFLAFSVVLALFARDVWRAVWKDVLLMFGVTALLAIPLMVSLGNQPESEGRVGELAVPITAIVEDRNFVPLWAYTRDTFSMYHATGDPEWLYNVPNRPIFTNLPSLLFWLGVLSTIIFAIRFLFKRGDQWTGLASIFILLWWLAGIAPAFISVPPASLSHTIVAQSAVYILLALPLGLLAKETFARKTVSTLFSILLLLLIGMRDLPDYFVEWPQRGMSRFLYRADITDVAKYVAQNPELTDFAISGALDGPWSRIALETAFRDEGVDWDVRPRWYHPERAVFTTPNDGFRGVPVGDHPFSQHAENPPTEQIGGYQRADTWFQPEITDTNLICFENNLCSILSPFSYVQDRGQVEISWMVRGELQIPDMPLLSNPPPPNVYSGPRLHVFAQALSSDGQFLFGDDGLWVDPLTLQDGDTFAQFHKIPFRDDIATIAFGLYDPMTGERILTEDGRDSIRIELNQR